MIIDVQPFGRVHVQFRSTSRRIVARWRSGELHLTAPSHSPNEILSFLRNNKEAILALRPQARFLPGMSVKAPEFAVEILTEPDRSTDYGTVMMARRGDYSLYHIKLNEMYLNDSTSAETQIIVEDLLLNVAVYMAKKILIPYAWECARRVGASPAQFKIHRAKGRYGSCSSRRIINLNPVLMFAPIELREFVICHELAHLTHMDHTAAFHALCDRYLGGREKVLNQALKRFRFPV